MKGEINELWSEIKELERRVRVAEIKVCEMDEGNEKLEKRIELLVEERLLKEAENIDLKNKISKKDVEIRKLREEMTKLKVSERGWCHEKEEGECEMEFQEESVRQAEKRGKELQKKVDRWKEEKEKRDKEEREESWRKTILIVKRGMKANKKDKIEE